MCMVLSLHAYCNCRFGTDACHVCTMHPVRSQFPRPPVPYAAPSRVPTHAWLFSAQAIATGELRLPDAFSNQAEIGQPTLLDEFMIPSKAVCAPCSNHAAYTPCPHSPYAATYAAHALQHSAPNHAFMQVQSILAFRPTPIFATVPPPIVYPNIWYENPIPMAPFNFICLPFCSPSPGCMRAACTPWQWLASCRPACPHAVSRPWRQPCRWGGW